MCNASAAIDIYLHENVQKDRGLDAELWTESGKGLCRAHTLVETPNICTEPASYPANDVPDVNRRPPVDLLYVTDRFRADDVTY